MSVTEPGVQRLRMSWDDYLALPDDVRAEWVDGEVVVSPRPSRAHGRAVARVSAVLVAALPDADVIAESGVHLPGNRLRGPDVMVARPESGDATWVEPPPLLVVEVLSPSTRREDLVRKGPEYAEGAVGQFWVVDPEARAIDVYVNAGGRWDLLLHLDDGSPTGEVDVAEHGVVFLDLAEILR